MGMKSNDLFTCGFCSKTYKREAALIKHKCQTKERMLLKDTRQMYIAVDCWKKFRQYHRMLWKACETPFEAFIKSREYTQFYDFSGYLMQTRPIKQEEFVMELIKQSIDIRNWSTQETRKQWVQTVLTNEHPDRGIERSLMVIQEWADENEVPWNEVFLYLPVGRAMLWIETGKISPWIIFTATTVDSLFERMTPEDFEYISSYLDANVWSTKCKLYSDDVNRIQEVFKEYKL